MEIIIVIGKSPWKNNHAIRSFPGEEKGAVKKAFD